MKSQQANITFYILRFPKARNERVLI